MWPFSKQPPSALLLHPRTHGPSPCLIDLASLRAWDSTASTDLSFLVGSFGQRSYPQPWADFSCDPPQKWQDYSSTCSTESASHHTQRVLGPSKPRQDLRHFEFVMDAFLGDFQLSGNVRQWLHQNMIKWKLQHLKGIIFCSRGLILIVQLQQMQTLLTSYLIFDNISFAASASWRSR